MKHILLLTETELFVLCHAISERLFQKECINHYDDDYVFLLNLYNKLFGQYKLAVNNPQKEG